MVQGRVKGDLIEVYKIIKVGETKLIRRVYFPCHRVKLLPKQRRHRFKVIGRNQRGDEKFILLRGGTHYLKECRDSNFNYI